MKETTVEARVRIQALYDKTISKEEVDCAIRLHDAYKDARHEGIYDFSEQSTEFCHVLPADTVNKVIAWKHNLDPKYAVLTDISRIIGIWWKLATRANMDYLIPVCQKRHGCDKVCGIVVPKGHGATPAIVPASTTHTST